MRNNILKYAFVLASSLSASVAVTHAMAQPHNQDLNGFAHPFENNLLFWDESIAQEISYPDRPARLAKTRIDTPGESAVLSFGYILRHNEIRDFGPSQREKNYSFSLDRNDMFVMALQKIQDRCIQDIHEDERFVQLLTQDHWTLRERHLWEERLANLVSCRVNGVPGFGEYRNMQNSEDVVRVSFLNALEKDIRNDTTEVEFDCEAMSFVEGYLVQTIERHFLPERDSDAGYKYCADYHYIGGGQVSFDSQHKVDGYHAYIVSGVTGAAIEATVDPDLSTSSSYVRPADPNYLYEDFISGAPLVEDSGENARVYGLTLSDKKVERARELALKMNMGRNPNDIAMSGP